MIAGRFAFQTPLALGLSLTLGGSCLTPGWSGEIRSNGQGGGSWTSPATWGGKAAPGPADAVIILAGDTVLFDGHCPEQAACRQLLIEAGGRLDFKAEPAPRIFGVAGPVEVRGRMRLDFSRQPKGQAELRLLAEQEADRIIRLASNAVFEVFGAPDLPGGGYNVNISPGPARPGAPPRAVRFQGEPGAGVDFKAAGFIALRECHSNGRGGGRWSDPETWHDRSVPVAADIVVVAVGDTVVFDGHCPEKPACRKLFIDHQGAVTFQADGRPHVLSVAGPIECYGALRLDGAPAAAGVLELRLAAPAAAERTISLLSDSALVLNGAERAGGGKNVVVSAADPEGTALIVAQDGVRVDLRRAELRNIVLQAAGLDNTGFQPGEGLNIVANDFTGLSRLALSGCDTPAVLNNAFRPAAEKPLAFPALLVRACKLAQLHQNTFAGRYANAIQAQQDTDSSASGNVISNAARGICWSGQNAMWRGNELVGCATGIFMEGADAVVENTSVRGSALALDLRRSQAQFTDVRVEDLPTNGWALRLEASAATLLNCNLEPPRIKAAGGSRVQAMQYLVVQVKGPRPPRTVVEVRTAAASGGPPKGGAADLNVRNSPARLDAEGFTPLPRSLRALVVRAWALDRDGRKTEAPFYDLIVSAPGEKGNESQTLKSVVIEPQAAWYRPEPNQSPATLEVALP